MFQTVSGEAYAPVADFQVSADTVEYQNAVAFAKLGDGGFVAVWADSRFGNGSMRMQRFDLNGVKIGAEIVLPAGSDAALAPTPSGGFLLTWTVEAPYPASFEVKARFYDSNLSPVSPEFGVNTRTDGFQLNDKVVALAGGGYVVTWGQPEDQTFDHVRAQVLDSAGNKIGGEIVVTENASGDKYPMGLTALAGGGFVAAWSGFEVADEFGNLSPGLRAQIFDSAGNKVGAAFSLNTIVPGTQSNSQLAGLPDGGFVAAWTDDGGRQSGGPTNGNQGVWVQLFDSLGQKVGAAVRVGSGGDSVVSTPTIAVTDTGFIVTFPELASMYAEQDELHAQRFDFAGNKVGEEFVVGGTAPATHVQLTNLVLDSGAILLGWTHRAESGFNYDDVHAQLLFPVVHGTESADGFSGTASRDFYLGKGGDDLALGAAGDDNLDGGGGGDVLRGEDGDDTLSGGDGNDLLDGGAGADQLEGGLGNDIYTVDSSDTVTEAANAGTDEVQTALAAYTLAADVEKLTGTSATGQTLTGNGLANLITGNAGNDVIAGGSGADRLIGGLGNDVYTMDTSDTVIEAANAGTDEIRTVLAAYTLGANVENLTGTSSAGQSLTGNDLANRLAGGTGADQFAGGLGNDVYLVGAGDIVTEAANAGTDEVQTALAAYTLDANVERLTGISAAGQTLTGNGLSNLVTGGVGNDVIAGGSGADMLAGGLGNDVYTMDTSDTIVEAANAGIDEVRTAIAAYTLGANVENLTGTSSAGQSLTGNGLANRLTGGGGNDVLDGGAGNDTLAGGNGADLLVGGTGADSLKGGAGADVFRYDAAADSTAAAPDLIGDFQVGVDKIDLHPIDANTFAAGDQAFHWIGANAFSGTGAASAGELRVYQSGSYWWAAGDTNGDGTADLVIAFTPQSGMPLGQGDFLL
jgi:Ca2+-binding RTX toxin-like protein